MVALAGMYAVRFVEDDRLPLEQDWVFVEVDGVLYFVVKKSQVTPDVLEDAWAAFRQIFRGGPPMPKPRHPIMLSA